jgi:hypothetical protein
MLKFLLDPVEFVTLVYSMISNKSSVNSVVSVPAVILTARSQTRDVQTFHLTGTNITEQRVQQSKRKSLDTIHISSVPQDLLLQHSFISVTYSWLA